MTARQALREHWPEYLMEAAGLGIFMLSACTFCVLLEHPAGPLHGLAPDLRRALMGLAMGTTAVALVYSPWGQQSGAHYNPAVTLTFARLGRIRAWDAAFYVAFQFLGGVAGVALAREILGPGVAHPAVHYAVTAPGPDGTGTAFLAETILSAFMMLAVLAVSNSPWSRWTGWVAGSLVALYIALEAPLSGMSLNPARSFGSACVAGDWRDLWIYFLAPLGGMTVGALLYGARPRCAKLNHHTPRRCIFRCGYHREV